MNILITNDDGANAEQLIPLAKWCRKLGDVTIVVPKSEQSAKSHSIEIRSAIEIKQVECEDDLVMWTVDSTPADCVRFAVFALQKTFDLVISGINRGYNLGNDIFYSGTLAAASEAVNKGIPAIALSTSIKYYDNAVAHLDEIFSYVHQSNLLKLGNLYNINIPVAPKGLRITRKGGRAFREEFTPMGGDFYFPSGKPMRTDGTDLNIDIDAVAKGYISITPMTIERTDLAVFEKLSNR